jgi:hypothetical protein
MQSRLDGMQLVWLLVAYPQDNFEQLDPVTLTQMALSFAVV